MEFFNKLKDLLAIIPDSVYTTLSTIFSVLFGIFVLPIVDIFKNKYSTYLSDKSEALMLRKMLYSHFDELLDVYCRITHIKHKLSNENKTVGNLCEALEYFQHLGGPRYQIELNITFVRTGIYTKILKTIVSIEKTNFRGWNKKNDDNRRILRISQAINAAIASPNSYLASDVLTVMCDFVSVKKKLNLYRRFIQLFSSKHTKNGA
jgi:hypothetical protein